MRKKKPSATKRAARRRPAARESSGITTRSRSHTDYNRNKVNISIGAVNKHKKAAREKLEKLIGAEEVKKFKAPLKRIKKKIAKKIAKYKADYRRLSA
jgi:hypothetical protein